jgi:hypothetical protein
MVDVLIAGSHLLSSLSARGAAKSAQDAAALYLTGSAEDRELMGTPIAETAAVGDKHDYWMPILCFCMVIELVHVQANFDGGEKS